MDDRIGPGEIDVFEDAGPSRLPWQRKKALHPFVVDDHHFAVFDVADEFRSNDVEGAGLRAKNGAALKLAEHQRANAERIAGADKLLVGQRDQRVGALDLGQGLDESVDDLGPARARGEQEHDFRIAGRLADRAAADELAAQRKSVGQVAVMGDREAAGLELGEQRLDIAQYGVAGRRVAHVADRRPPGQAVDGRAAREVIADQPLPALRVEPDAVESDDAGGLLAAMLQRVQPERDDRRGVGVIEDAEDATFLAQPVAVRIEAAFARRGPVPFRRRRRHCFAGPNGAFLLIKASSFCLSIAEPLDPAVESGFFGG